MNTTKKIGLFLFGILAFSFGISSAYSAQTERFVSAFEKELAKKNATEQKSYLELIESLMNDPKIKEKSELKTLSSELLDWTAVKLGKKVSQSQQSFRQFSIPVSIDLAGVDAQQLRDAWLGWHNTLRAQKGLEPLVYHSELERSATEWSKKQAENGYVGHKRKSSDGYYNYASLQQRFADLGIKFANLGGGRSAFSESMGYRGYSCSAGDCTKAAIDATKKSFDSFAAEGERGVHYRAIVMPHYKYVGFGFAVDTKKNMIYTTIHYGTDILE